MAKKESGPTFTATMRVVVMVEVTLPGAKTFEEASQRAAQLPIEGLVQTQYPEDNFVDFSKPVIVSVTRTDVPWVD